MPRVGPKYPKIRLKLSGRDGNAYSIIARARKAMRDAGVSDELIDEFTRECKSGDYDNVLRTCMDWVNVV